MLNSVVCKIPLPFTKLGRITHLYKITIEASPFIPCTQEEKAVDLCKFKVTLVFCECRASQGSTGRSCLKQTNKQSKNKYNL